ncbi:MAG: hypothetical protein HC860_21060 [Alkalinema sp. RU_4_3]|nr:hypothetical protein [Alkalinema sp. RU_4_3]
MNLLKWTETVGLMLGLVEDEGLAVRVVERCLGVDLMLGAKLAGKVRSTFQEKTVELISKAEVENLLMISFQNKLISEKLSLFHSNRLNIQMRLCIGMYQS